MQRKRKHIRTEKYNEGILKFEQHQNKRSNQVMICFTKEREAQKAVTEIKQYEGWNAEVYKIVSNKKSNGKTLSLFEDKQEQNRKTERKTEGSF